MKLEIQVLAWDRHKTMAGLNHLMRSQHISCEFDLQLQYRLMLTNDFKNNYRDALPLKNTHTLILSQKMNNNIIMASVCIDRLNVLYVVTKANLEDFLVRT